ncbi:MAG: outer membrane lipoprotein-sorting protein [Ignavibacteriales bacterium]|nr:outer membrane lipoprotein-sorting protein [Ignavibacteriales bacterium]
MKIKILFISILFAIFLISCNTDLSPEEIIEKYREAKGCDKLENVQSLIATEKIQFANNDSLIAYSRMIKSRPLKSRIEFFAGLSLIEIYNGKDGWYLDEFSDMKNPEKMSPEKLIDVRQKAHIDDPVGSYKKLGYSIELEETEKINGREAYVIKLTTEKDNYAFYYIDKENFMLLKHKFSGSGEFKDYTFEKVFSDYRKVEDILFAYSIEMYLNGVLQNKSTVMELLLNKNVSDSLFEKIR